MFAFYINVVEQMEICEVCQSLPAFSVALVSFYRFTTEIQNFGGIVLKLL